MVAKKPNKKPTRKAAPEPPDYSDDVSFALPEEKQPDEPDKQPPDSEALDVPYPTKPTPKPPKKKSSEPPDYDDYEDTYTATQKPPPPRPAQPPGVQKELWDKAIAAVIRCAENAAKAERCKRMHDKAGMKHYQNMQSALNSVVGVATMAYVASTMDNPSDADMEDSPALEEIRSAQNEAYADCYERLLDALPEEDEVETTERQGYSSSFGSSGQTSFKSKGKGKRKS